MKLTYYSEQTLPKKKGGQKLGVAAVTFSSRGLISFSMEACRLMELKGGDKIIFSQDEDAPENWYFFKDKAHGFAIRETKAKGCVTNHKLLVDEFKGKIGLPSGRTYRALIAGQPTYIKNDAAKIKYWGVIVRSSL